MIMTAKNHKNPTMKDVAEQVGVSVQTVSAVINDKPGITLETRERVLSAIEELGYRPFSIARSLRTRRTHTIALIVPDIANPSFSTIASAAEDVAHASGYSLVNYNTHESPEREANYIHTAAERWVDGVLFVPSRDQVHGLHRLQQVGIPCVAIDRNPESYSGPSVTLNNIQAGELATNHLINLGHRHLAHISGPRHLGLARERQLGFQQAIKVHRLPEGLVINSAGWGCEDGFSAFKTFLDANPRPTAVFAASDRIAIGFMHAANLYGLHIPDDISIIGLDDVEVAAYQNPPLTTVQQSFTELATIAMQLLLSLVNGEQRTNNRLILEPHLIVRKSTAAVRTASFDRAVR
jgi:DNA-binding LacI/PurR family transcriptional regulator